jgi:LacI family transcriptional regulator, gluconate utilization system Gnt-I transcriptional repressor
MIIPQAKGKRVTDLLGTFSRSFESPPAHRLRQLLRKANIPVIEMGTLPAEPIEVAVGYSNEAAAQEMTRYLIAKGHRSIGFVSAPPDRNDRAAARLQGYRTALHEAAIDPDPTLVRESSFGIREGRILLDYFIGLSKSPTAIFCASDLWAVGMIGQCIRQGIAVPGDIAIVGFNDQEIASEISPSITTIRVPRYEIGRVAGKVILDRIAGIELDGPAIDLGFELVRRESA